MVSIPDVTLIQGDLTEDAVFSQVRQAIVDHPGDLVIFDMAPNMNEVRSEDQCRAMCLSELALGLASKVLLSLSAG